MRSNTHRTPRAAHHTIATDPAITFARVELRNGRLHARRSYDAATPTRRHVARALGYARGRALARFHRDPGVYRLCRAIARLARRQRHRHDEPATVSLAARQ